MGCGCGCADVDTGQDPMASRVRAHMAGLSGPTMMGDILPTFVFPSDVAAYKKKIDPDFKATDAAVRTCAGLPSPEAVAWGDFYTDWRKFADASTTLLGSWEAQLTQAKRFESELSDWQDLIGKSCKLIAPKLSPPSAPFPTGTVLLVAGGAVIAAALGYSFYRTAKQAGARARKGREFLERRVDERLEARVLSSSTALARR